MYPSTRLGDDLFESIAFASSKGLLTRIVTNGEWAENDESARKMIESFRSVGLNELNISYDDFHSAWIPVDYVTRAWKLSKGQGFSSVVFAVGSGPHSRITPETMMRLMGEDVPLAYDESGRPNKSAGVADDGTSYMISNSKILRIGRGRTLRESYCRFRKTSDVYKEINASCNSLSDNVIVRTGDLFSPLGPKETFDVIVANPPLLPIPEGIPYPFVGDGGPDGLTVVRRIIAGMRGRLTNQGQFLMVGMSCRDDFSILSTSELSDMLSGAGLAGLMTVISSYGIGDTNPWISGVALTSKAHSPQSAANIREIKERLVREYAQQGATAVCTYVLRAWPSACPKLTVRDYSGDNNDRAPWIMT